ncbi:MAG: hypothetical protein IKZ98_15545 [Clostridia bacterium]|nr:hypothetical protein [Clostridia bacterium]
MNRRILCLLTAFLLALPSVASPSTVCDHYDPDGNLYPKYQDGYVEPKPGVPGYSGDFRCSNCHAIVEKGYVLYYDDDYEGYYDCENPPTDKPDPRIDNPPPQYGDPSETDPNNPDNPNNPGNPDNPDSPGNPDNPDNPDSPVTPGQNDPQDPPANPDNPVTPAQTDPQEQPGEPQAPEQPVTPGGSNPQEQPTQPEEPVQPVIPAQQEPEKQADPEEPVQPVSPSEPVQPEAPVQPADSARSDDTAEPASPEQPVIPPQQDIPADQETPAEITPTPPPVPGENDPVEPAVTASPLGHRTSRGTGVKMQEPFSEQYPYRRVKMTPEKNIRAKAAGVLLWPAPPSPFQQMLQ